MKIIIASLLMMIAAALHAHNVVAADASILFHDGEDTVHFKLSAVDAPDKSSPEKELLDADENKQAIAELLKEERNKNLKDGLTAPDDKESLGLKIRFDGIRFVKDPDDPQKVRVRLVGPINEIEYSTPLLITDLLQAEKPIPLQFKSVTKKTGVTVTILTDLRVKLDDGDLRIYETEGSIDFHVGTFSPARVFYSSDSDKVSLPDLAGKRVTEDELPYRTLLEPEKL